MWMVIGSVISISIATVITTAIIGTVNNQHVNDVGVACVTHGGQWTANMCVNGNTKVVVSD